MGGCVVGWGCIVCVVGLGWGVVGSGRVVGRGGSGGVGVVLRLRSNAERGMAAGGVWVDRLVVVVDWDLRLRVLTGWVGVEVVRSAGGLRWRDRCVKCIGCLAACWDWVAILGGGVSADVVVGGSSLMSVIVSSIASRSNSSAASDPGRLVMWSYGSVYSAMRSAMRSARSSSPLMDESQSLSLSE